MIGDHEKEVGELNQIALSMADLIGKVNATISRICLKDLGLAPGDVIQVPHKDGAFLMRVQWFFQPRDGAPVIQGVPLDGSADRDKYSVHARAKWTKVVHDPLKERSNAH